MFKLYSLWGLTWWEERWARPAGARGSTLEPSWSFQDL